ncbi:hypothetical protein Achl_4153 (plasmid) [Pseudarthrobacter chlorophenolicus A6]|uniref:Uncharacterized protein n=1 Tax=Pseudarthrobacter chlorophenolicus (strain ATCC 700700 / DSM 12829 / CIP 107037 / JCM 12360 / KCTC 9906 / NCIMB 13794 / A6) TaxID=452863 RepID=B8HI57_PSECP|nr:hypothetical protein [Pseudarthrobacter chlorophenolicus]ACL42104.1 hypothetical protein Achl_4153 [Pseudarthrobacter chlorophenolicus A6]SDQ13482.1 hypothetical protein SAMN04489738_0212 [Pseudarthrobacter chlorophenolicus]
MPPAQVKALTEAFTGFRAALDPNDAWANGRLAVVIRAADAAGWSRRTTASALGISRERLQRIARFPAAARHKMPRHELGSVFPAASVAAFRKHEDEVSLRRTRTEKALVAILRAAHHDAGWPYNILGALVEVSGERLRQIAETPVDVTGEQAPTFDTFTRLVKERPAPREGRKLDEAEVERLRRLADRARTATKSVGKRLGSNPSPEQVRALESALQGRLASEELSALLIGLKEDNVSWPDLDSACGYKPGGARARAIRHGYAQTPPSMSRYTPTQLPGWPQPAAVSQLTDSHSV